jgi:hypothetical protein
MLNHFLSNWNCYQTMLILKINMFVAAVCVHYKIIKAKIV